MDHGTGATETNRRTYILCHKDRKCRRCGELDEFMYEINWQPVYYCATCDVESGGGAEMVGRDERLMDEAGE
jgi:hypothetical protein